MLTSNEMPWVAAPPTLPAGVKIAVIEGNPGEAGPFIGQMTMSENR